MSTATIDNTATTTDDEVVTTDEILDEVVTTDEILDEADGDTDEEHSIGALLIRAAQESDASRVALQVSEDKTREALALIAKDYEQKNWGASTRLKDEVKKAVAANMGVKPKLLLGNKEYDLPTSVTGAKLWVALGRVAGLSGGAKIDLKEAFSLARSVYMDKSVTKEADKAFEVPEGSRRPTAKEVLAKWGDLVAEAEKDEDAADGGGDEKDAAEALFENLVPGDAAVLKALSIANGSAKPEVLAKYLGTGKALTAHQVAGAIARVTALSTALDNLNAALTTVETATPKDDSDELPF